MQTAFMILCFQQTTTLQTFARRNHSVPLQPFLARGQFFSSLGGVTVTATAEKGPIKLRGEKGEKVVQEVWWATKGQSKFTTIE
jgi:hypothetical protein